MPFHSTSKKAKKAKKKPPSAYSKYETHPLGVALPAGKRFLQLLEQHSASLDTFAYDESGAYGRIPARAGPELLFLDAARTQRIFSQTRFYCMYLFLSGLAASSTGSLIVEMGTLSGGSSRCIAAGLESSAVARAIVGNATQPPVFMAFDDFWLFPKKGMVEFGLRPDNPMMVAHERARKDGTRYHNLVWKDVMVAPVYSGPLEPVPGPIERTAAERLDYIRASTAVEIWSIDSAKLHAQFLEQAAHVWPRLRVGSIIHLMDFVKAQNFFWISEFVLTGDVTVASISLVSASWTFVVNRAPLDWSKVTGWEEKAKRMTPEESLRLCKKMKELYEAALQKAKPPAYVTEHARRYVSKTPIGKCDG
jgi:hypothetical protein